MCDTATTNAIEQAVLDKVRKQEIFTTFDITKAARQSSGLRFLHRDVTCDVHEAISRLAHSYLRTLISIPNVPDRPFLYFPQGADPNLYGICDQSQIRVASAAPAPTSASLTNVGDHSPSPANDAGAFEQDAQGRIWIPSHFIVALNVQPQAPVYVTQFSIPGADGCSIPVLKITSAVPAWAKMAVEFLVDRRLNVAISRGVLIDAGIDGQGKYKIEGSATEIIVKAAATGSCPNPAAPSP